MDFNFATTLREAARIWGDRSMLLSEEVDLSYAEVARRTAALAANLADLGLQPGEHVVVQLPNVPEFVTNYFGVLQAGLTVVPVNPLLSPGEVLTILEDCDARVLVSAQADVVEAVTAARPDRLVEIRGFGAAGTVAPVTEWENHERPLTDPVPVDGHQTAFVIYTSGTTGKPKGAEISHLQAFMSSAAEGDMLDISTDDVVLAALPMFHVFGLSTILNAGVRKGECFFLMPNFDATALARAIDEHGITILAGVPTMYFELLAVDRSQLDMSSVRALISGGAAMPVEVIRRLEEEFPGTDYVEGYGMSESTASGTVNGGVFERRLGSIGRAVWGVDVRVVDASGETLPPGEGNVGELVIRGPNVMKGYINQPELTAETVREGWLHTGDLAHMDAEGYFFVVGRIKDLIIRGGYNVHPRDVEEVIHELEGVEQVAVVGRPDDRLGEEVVAFVVADSSLVDAAKVTAHCRERLARYKVPREIHFMDNLPKGATGKIHKEALSVEAEKLA